jgi:hypothetical protein
MNLNGYQIVSTVLLNEISNSLLKRASAAAKLKSSIHSKAANKLLKIRDNHWIYPGKVDDKIQKFSNVATNKSRQHHRFELERTARVLRTKKPGQSFFAGVSADSLKKRKAKS